MLIPHGSLAQNRHLCTRCILQSLQSIAFRAKQFPHKIKLKNKPLQSQLLDYNEYYLTHIFHILNLKIVTIMQFVMTTHYKRMPTTVWVCGEVQWHLLLWKKLETMSFSLNFFSNLGSEIRINPVWYLGIFENLHLWQLLMKTVKVIECLHSAILSSFYCIPFT